MYLSSVFKALQCKAGSQRRERGPVGILQCCVLSSPSLTHSLSLQARCFWCSSTSHVGLPIALGLYPSGSEWSGGGGQSALKTITYSLIQLITQDKAWVGEPPASQPCLLHGVCWVALSFSKERSSDRSQCPYPSLTPLCSLQYSRLWGCRILSKTPTEPLTHT